MSFTTITKTFLPPSLNRKEILRYASVNSPTSEYDDLIDDCLKEASPHLKYTVCYRELRIAHDGEYLDLGFAKVLSRDLKKNLDGCDKAILFGATIGISLDRLIAKYSMSAPSKALIFDALGSERIESLCDAFCAYLSDEGFLQRPRFSAGYGDLSISLQKDICDTLNTQKHIGLCLNESMLMSPSKSVTAIIGIKKSTF